MKPVSICIPSYKATHFKECLTSAIAQTYKNIEIIVSDDCPNDDIKCICEQFNGQVKYIRNPNPGGSGRNNINHLCEISRGEYLKFLFDDDILNPFCVQNLVESLDATADSHTTLAFSPRAIIDAENREKYLVNAFNVKSLTVISGQAIIFEMARRISNPIGEFSTVLFRKRDIIDNMGAVRICEVDGEVWTGLGDVATWVHLAMKGNIVIHPAVLSYFRTHDQSNSNHKLNPEWVHMLQDWKKLVDWAYRREMLQGKQLATAHQKIIRLFRSWLPLYPQLKTDLLALQQQIDELPIAAWRRWKIKHELRRAINTPL